MSKQSAYFNILEYRGNPEKLKKSLDAVRGVISVSYSKSSNNIAVDYDSTGTGVEELSKALADSGCSARLAERQDHTM